MNNIEVITEIVPKASGSFPVVDAHNIRGGYRSVASISDRDAITAASKRSGMLVYVEATGFAYRLTSDGSWLPDNIRASGMSYVSGFLSTGSITFLHQMGYFPNITIIDAVGDRIWGQVVYNNINSLTVNFNQPIAGTGYLS